MVLLPSLLVLFFACIGFYTGLRVIEVSMYVIFIASVAILIKDRLIIVFFS